ncbi:MAG: MFS transporter [archaeon]|nr:MFS transporter [archaeon]
METETYYKNHYKYIFAFFYFIQGIVQALPMVITLLYFNSLPDVSPRLDYNALISSLGTLPWSFKFLIGAINDRWGSKKLGRRFPFIIGFGIIGGISWILMAFLLPTDDSIYISFTIFYIFISIGMAYSDTAIDGLILDITPKDKLTSVNAYTWASLLVGSALGGFGLGLLFIEVLHAAPILFLLIGIMMLISVIFPYFIKEPPIEDVQASDIFKDIKNVLTSSKNYKIFLWTFLGRISGALIAMNHIYYILWSEGLIQLETATSEINLGADVLNYGLPAIVAFGLSGLGTVFGSLLAGKISDKNRKKGVLLSYIFTIPGCFLSIIMRSLILGTIIQFIMGIGAGCQQTASQTVRGDITNNEYPKIKSTYYSILIAMSNLGLNLGTLMSGLILASFLAIFGNFIPSYAILAVISAVFAIVNLLAFFMVNPKSYEFDHIIKENEESIQDNR